MVKYCLRLVCGIVAEFGSLFGITQNAWVINSATSLLLTSPKTYRKPPSSRHSPYNVGNKFCGTVAAWSCWWRSPCGLLPPRSRKKAIAKPCSRHALPMIPSRCFNEAAKQPRALVSSLRHHGLHWGPIEINAVENPRWCLK
jgi:hypothetical protein